MTKEFCDICGRPIETHKNVSEFKLIHTSQWRTTNEMLLS